MAKNWILFLRDARIIYNNRTFTRNVKFQWEWITQISKENASMVIQWIKEYIANIDITRTEIQTVSQNHMKIVCTKCNKYSSIYWIKASWTLYWWKTISLFMHSYGLHFYPCWTVVLGCSVLSVSFQKIFLIRRTSKLGMRQLFCVAHKVSLTSKVISLGGKTEIRIRKVSSFHRVKTRKYNRTSDFCRLELCKSLKKNMQEKKKWL